MLDPEAWILSWAWGNPRKPAGPVPKLAESLILRLWMGGESEQVDFNTRGV